MAKDKIRSIQKHTIIQGLLFVITLVSVFLAGWLRKIPDIMQLRNVVMTVLGLSGIIFRLKQMELEHDEALRMSPGNSITDINEEKGMSNQYYIWFLFGIGLSIFFSFMPSSGWPFPVLAMILALYSDTIIGILSTSLFIFISVSLNGADFSIFYLYFVCSMISILLFQKLDDRFKFYIPLLLSELSIIIATTAEVLLAEAGRLSLESFIIPLINVFISALFYLIFLKYYSVTRIHRYSDRYSTIADQEYSLMVDLKQKSKEAYFLAIHTAYFSNKIAGMIQCDPVLAKAGSYYHNLRELCNPNTTEAYEQLLREHDFPPALYELLMDYRRKVYHTKEAGVIYFSDTVVSSIMYLFHKNKDAKIDYDQMIDMIFDKKINSGVLNQCSLSLSDIDVMRNLFKEEKLYYDFLR